MRLWPRPLIVAGIGVVSQGPEEGQTAVPVGGGGARPGSTQTHRPIGGRREACGARPGFETTHRATNE